MNKSRLAVRVIQSNPDHHLWNNNGTWWCHYTLHLSDFTKRRIRRSLRTKSLVQARKLRNGLLAFGMLEGIGRDQTSLRDWPPEGLGAAPKRGCSVVSNTALKQKEASR